MSVWLWWVTGVSFIAVDGAVGEQGNASSVARFRSPLAWVNDTPIYSHELDGMMARVRTQLQKRYTDKVPARITRRVRSFALDQRITEILVLQRGRQSVPRKAQRELRKKAEERVEGKLKREAGRPKRDVRSAEQRAHRQAVDQETDRLLIQRVVREEVLRNIYIRPTRGRRYYREHTDEFRVPGRASFHLIAFPSAYYPSAEKARRFAEKVRQKALGGDDFATLVERYSIGPDAEKGGHFQDVRQEDLAPELNPVVFGLEPGGVSEVFKFAQGYAIVKVTTLQRGRVRSFGEDEVQMRIFRKLGEEKLDEHLKAYGRKLRRQADVVVVMPGYRSEQADDAPPDGNRLQKARTLRRLVAEMTSEAPEAVDLQEDRAMSEHPMGVALLASLATLLSPSPAHAESVYFREGQEAIVADVVGETTQEVLLRVPRHQIAKILRNGREVDPPTPFARGVKAAGTQPAPAAATAPAKAPAALVGAWREDDRFITITLGGQEIRLVKQGMARFGGTSLWRGRATMGEAWGKVLWYGKPLPDCQVKIVKLPPPSLLGYSAQSIARDSLTFQTATDSQGTFRFTNVPAGGYKLFWRLPKTSSWIRRMDFKPDFAVEASRSIRVKDIVGNRRTIN